MSHRIFGTLGPIGQMYTFAHSPKAEKFSAEDLEEMVCNSVDAYIIKHGQTPAELHVSDKDWTPEELLAVNIPLTIIIKRNIQSKTFIIFGESEFRSE